jgi:GTP-binding protein Era
VTAKPQTTRHRILGILSGASHQGVLVDTPGVLCDKLRTALDGAMMRTVRTAVTQADVLLVVVDAAAAHASGDPASGLDGLQLTGESGGPPLCVLLNKADLLPAESDGLALQRWFAQQPGVSACLCASAQQGLGVSELEAWLVAHLPPGQSLYPKDSVSEHPERFFCAEIVREKIFQQYRQEIPYCTSVQVTHFREARSAKEKDHICMTVFVERDSQKPIILGRGGTAIKALAMAARADMEEFLGRPVFLELLVKVAQDWRDSDEALDRLGVVNASQML